MFAALSTLAAVHLLHCSPSTTPARDMACPVNLTGGVCVCLLLHRQHESESFGLRPLLAEWRGPRTARAASRARAGEDGVFDGSPPDAVAAVPPLSPVAPQIAAPSPLVAAAAPLCHTAVARRAKPSCTGHCRHAAAARASRRRRAFLPLPAPPPAAPRLRSSYHRRPQSAPCAAAAPLATVRVSDVSEGSGVRGLVSCDGGRLHTCAKRAVCGVGV